MLDIQPIKTRAALATVGPWSVTSYGGGLNFGNPLRVHAGTDPEFGEPRAIPAVDADAQFIAHAREDVPALVNEVERLREENRRLTADVKDLESAVWVYQDRLIKVRKIAEGDC